MLILFGIAWLVYFAIDARLHKGLDVFDLWDDREMERIERSNNTIPNQQEQGWRTSFEIYLLPPGCQSIDR